MSVAAVAVIGIAAVLLAVELKGVGGQYGIYLAAAAGLVIFFYSVEKLSSIIDILRRIQESLSVNTIYLGTLMKLVGISYLSEFSSGICKDAGYGALGSQIEIFGKLSILAVSMPIFLAALQTVQEFFL